VVKYRTLDGTFGALSDPTRRQMMVRLEDGEASVSELAAPHKMSLPAISRHISVLEEAGLVFKRKEGRQHYCSLATSPLREVDSWLRRFRGAPAPATTTQREETHG
jgi:DNA-binding transcriptional ArsR family regulator